MKKKYDRATHEHVLAARQEGKTLKEISSETRVCLTLVKKWLKEAAGQKIAGIHVRRYYTQAEREKILTEYAENHSPKKSCVKYHIVKSTLFRWKRLKKVIATSQAGTVYTAGKLHKMNRELESLRKRNEIISLCRCSSSASTQEKIEEVKRLRNLFTVRSLCRVLNLSHTTFYRVTQQPRKKTVYETNDETLRGLIEAEFYDSGERFGAAMIKVKLNERGYVVSPKHIRRLMKEMHLVCKQNRPCVYITTHRNNNCQSNLLQRNFTQDVPNKFWVSDMTSARVKEKFYAICTVLDLFSRKVLSYGISAKMNTKFVKTIFLEAFESRNRPEGLTFHSDQGAQYTSCEFRKTLHDLGVRQSLSTPGTPLDNAVAESFFSIFKREELSHNWYNSLGELDQTVRDYIEFYNFKRPHRKLNLQTPDQYEREYWAKHQNN